MITLEHNQHVVFEQLGHGRFVAHKTPHAFSAIALDHAHEQVNTAVKGDSGVVGLTENTSALMRWKIAGPEIFRMIAEFQATANTDIPASMRLHEQTPVSNHHLSTMLGNWCPHLKSLVIHSRRTAVIVSSRIQQTS